MVLDLPSFISLLSFFALCAVLFKTIKGSRPNPNSGLKLPPGPRKLPLIGNLHQLISSVPPHRVLSDLANKHGHVMHLKLGEVSTVIVSSPEAAKEVLKTHDINFANRPSQIASEILFYKNSDIIFSPHGEYWRQLRKICTIELLSSRRVQSFRSLREEEFSNMCRGIASKEGSLINLTKRISLTVCYTIIQASLGKRMDKLTKFTSIATETVYLMEGFHMADMYPSMKLFQFLSRTQGRAKRLHKLSDTLLEDIINDHKVAGDEKGEREDLVDVLLKFNKPGHELFLTMENIKAVIGDMFVAAIESSSTTMDWAMAELLKQPMKLEKAQDEVRRVFCNKGFVDESDIEELKYLKLVIKETLRMHPPAPLLVPRENRERCEIRGYEIPAKTRVMVNAWAIGRDPKYWEDANSFIPERFLENPVDWKGNNFEYLPFGGGRRMCPGMTFGLANIELPLAMLLYYFDWVLPRGIKPENIDMTETFGITAARKYPLYVIPIVKKPLLKK